VHPPELFETFQKFLHPVSSSTAASVNLENFAIFMVAPREQLGVSAFCQLFLRLVGRIAVQPGYLS
jgi:hypothetical protein